MLATIICLAFRLLLVYLYISTDIVLLRCLFLKVPTIAVFLHHQIRLTPLRLTSRHEMNKATPECSEASQDDIRTYYYAFITNLCFTVYVKIKAMKKHLATEDVLPYFHFLFYI